MRSEAPRPDEKSERPSTAVWAARGFSSAELLAVLAILSMGLLLASAAWGTYRRKADVGQTARVVKTLLYRARMLSVYQGVNHFLVLDPQGKSVSIYRDSSAPAGKLDPGDVRVVAEAIPAGCFLALPPSPAVLPNPMGGAQVTNAWSLPLPEASAWGTSLRGVMTNAAGLIQSAESTPQTVVSGVMVFTDGRGQTSAVGVRGQAGNVRAFELLATTWKEL